MSMQKGNHSKYNNRQTRLLHYQTLLRQCCWQTVQLFHSVGHQSILCTNKAHWQIPLTDVRLARKQKY